MDTVELLKKVGYKQVFNFLYSSTYRNHLSSDDIMTLDLKYRKAFDEIIVNSPEAPSVKVTVADGDDLIAVAAQTFLNILPPSLTPTRDD